MNGKDKNEEINQWHRSGASDKDSGSWSDTLNKSSKSDDDVRGVLDAQRMEEETKDRKKS